MDHRAWIDAAGPLGLGLYAGGPYQQGIHLRWLMSQLGPWTDENVWPWMAGRWRDHDVVVLPLVDFKLAILADLAPPLSFPCWTRTMDYPSPEDSSAEGGLPARAIPLVQEVLGRLPHHCATAVSPSTVELRTLRLPLGGEGLARHLDTSVAVANAVRAAIESELRPAIVDRFTDLAGRHGLTTNGLGLVTGTIAGMSVRFDFQVEPFDSYVQIDARFPTSLELGLDLTWQMHGFSAFMTRLLDRSFDLRIGVPELDDTFTLHTHDLEGARARFTDPALVRTLKLLATSAVGFRMTDEGLFARNRVTASDETFPEKLFEALSVVGGSLFPAAGVGPYR